MFYKQIIRILAAFLFVYAAVLVIPLFSAAYYQFWVDPQDHPQPHSTLAFGLTIVICLLLAYFCQYSSKYQSSALYRQEAIATVFFIWIITPLIGALPFYFSGTLERFDQAYFESFSGFTTTGATVMDGKKYLPDGSETTIVRDYCGMQNVTYEFLGTIKSVTDPKNGETLYGLEAVSRAILLWRSLMQWLGGIGITVIFIALFPALGIGGKTLLQAETSSMSQEGIAPRIKDTALQLLKIYGGLTLLQMIILPIVDSELPLLDIVTLTLSNVSLGGFSIHNENIAYYQSARIEWVVLAFMFLSSINFSLYYYAIKGKFFRILDKEFLLYLFFLIIFGSIASWELMGHTNRTFYGDSTGVYSASEAIRFGFFQMLSAQTSSGFFSDDYDFWPASIQVLMLFSMYLGGMAGSAAGGIKMIRVYLLFQIAKEKIISLFQPNTVTSIQFRKREIDTKNIITVLCFFLVVICFSALGSYLYILDDVDVDTAFSLTAAMITNTGIGLRAAGPTSTVAFLSPFSTWLSCFLMLLGRLEFYAVLIVLIPEFWKNPDKG